VRTGTFLLEGPNAVGDAMADGIVLELFCTEDTAAEWEGHGPLVTLVAEHVLAKICDASSPQGVVAIGAMEPATLDDLPADGLVIACHEVNDPGNAGALIRIADAVAAAGVVLCEGSADPYHPKTVRAAAGSLTHLPVVPGIATLELVAAAQRRGIVVALDGSGTIDIDDVPIDRPVTLLAGAEARGLPADVMGACDVVACLPIWGRNESLNLGAAVAVAAYSLTRRIRTT
jgi:TrmH family RNA methyltransferase